MISYIVTRLNSYSSIQLSDTRQFFLSICPVLSNSAAFWVNICFYQISLPWAVHGREVRQPGSHTCLLIFDPVTLTQGKENADIKHCPIGFFKKWLQVTKRSGNIVCFQTSCEMKCSLTHEREARCDSAICCCCFVLFLVFLFVVFASQ